MTPTKRRKKGATITEMPAPEDNNTPKTPFDEIPDGAETHQKPAPDGADEKPRESRSLPPPRKFDLPPEEWFAYWIACEKIAPGRLTLYGYRTLPVCDVTQPLTPEQLRDIQQKKAKAPAKNILKLVAPPIANPEDWNRWICEQKGAGDYHFKLTDNHPSVKKCIAMSTTSGEGRLRDWDAYPPDLNPEEVVLDDPKNAAYLRWARLHGITFPGDPGALETQRNEEEDAIEMANAQVLESLTRQNEKLQDKVVEMAAEKNRAPTVNAPDPGARAQMGGVEVVIEASKQSAALQSEMWREMMKNNVKSNDPLEQMKVITEVAKALQPPPSSGNSDIVMLMSKQLDAQLAQAKADRETQDRNFERILKIQSEAHEKQTALLSQRLESMEKQLTDSRAQPRTTPEEASLDSYLRIRKKIKEAEEDDGGEEAPQDPPWVRLVEKGIDGLGDVMRGIAALKAVAPVAVPPQTINAEPLPVAPPAPVDKELEQRMNYAKMLHPHIVAAMKENTPGYEFGAALITQAGQGAYDALAGGGYAGVTQFLQLHQPMWQELLNPPLGGLLEKFIAEFLDRPKVMQALAILKGNPAPPPPAAPAPGGHRGPKVNG